MSQRRATLKEKMTLINRLHDTYGIPFQQLAKEFGVRENTIFQYRRLQREQTPEVPQPEPLAESDLDAVRGV